MLIFYHGLSTETFFYKCWASTTAFQLKHLYHKKAHTGQTHRTLHLSLKRPLRRLATEPFWVPYTAYTKGERIQHHNTCYQCTGDHQSSYDFANDTKFWTVTQKWSDALQNANTPSFFLFDRGKKALNYAIDLAKNQIAQSARFIKLSVTLPLEAFHTITTNDSLTLKFPFAPFKRATGKITHYQIVCDGATGEKTIRVTCAFCAGHHPPTKAFGRPAQYVLWWLCQRLHTTSTPFLQHPAVFFITILRHRYRKIIMWSWPCSQNIAYYKALRYTTYPPNKKQKQANTPARINRCLLRRRTPWTHAFCLRFKV